MFLEMITRMLQQIAVLNTTGADRFARAAAETQVDVPYCGISKRQPAVLHGAHQVNTSAGRVIFVAGFQISRTGTKAEPAMNAGQGFGFVQEERGR